MSCGCSNMDKNNGRNVVDLVRSKGKGDFPLRTTHDIECVNCSKVFTMTTHVDKCPHCNMVYGVTPCSSMDKNNIKPAGVNY
ncbi:MULTISPECIES: hypothetical protein [Romboutsia]|uniref:Uncharacterized protein n=1 Tax=Romboutsia hominis TaxID=1507512 RepID=A0A2P2BNX3_9FIRM|nr:MULTISPECIES: hypothetical protein [Romboutsia]MCH1959276.1 hypothetical protein [Romboutsia hominis]MCH1970175.1 hypothetical protein [Romboutsia hominis]MDB8790154.1 hypothetical protein [Romboutsia sp. 1001216sp1]MDB8792185.1 hypothetical protein [Romboutsia sp. 1001216sp1]MDB8797152.1 hypothetical protein [Romboutsia sp. 1001216sp1]